MKSMKKMKKISILFLMCVGNLINKGTAATAGIEGAQKAVDTAVKIVKNTAETNRELAGLAEDTYKKGMCPSFRAKFLAYLYCASQHEFGQENYEVKRIPTEEKQLCRNGLPITRFKTSKDIQYGSNILGKGISKTAYDEGKAKGGTRDQLRSAGNAMYHPEGKTITRETKKMVSDIGVPNTNGCVYKFHSAYYETAPNESRLTKIKGNVKKEFTLTLKLAQPSTKITSVSYHYNDICEVTTRRNLQNIYPNIEQTGIIADGNQRVAYQKEMEKCCRLKMKTYVAGTKGCGADITKKRTSGKPKPGKP